MVKYFTMKFFFFLRLRHALNVVRDSRKPNDVDRYDCRESSTEKNTHASCRKLKSEKRLPA